MKKVVIFCGVMALLWAFTSCSKERTCRCAVRGNQTIRIVKIDAGTCDQLQYILYDEHPVLYPDRTDSILCTDFDFENYTN